METTLEPIILNRLTLPSRAQLVLVQKKLPDRAQAIRRHAQLWFLRKLPGRNMDFLEVKSNKLVDQLMRHECGLDEAQKIANTLVSDLWPTFHYKPLDFYESKTTIVTPIKDEST
jgi:hypothetical protein